MKQTKHGTPATQRNIDGIFKPVRKSKAGKRK